MITLTTQHGGSISIPLTNVIGTNVSKDCAHLIRYYENGGTRSMVIANTPNDVAIKMFIARHGKMPSKEVLKYTGWMDE